MTSIAQSMSQIGFAPVYVVLNRDQKDQAEGLRNHFVAEPTSPLGGASMIAAVRRGDEAPEPARARVYPNLGIVYGTVDPDGLAALRAEPSVRIVKPANQFSLIRPVTVAAAALRQHVHLGPGGHAHPGAVGPGADGGRCEDRPSRHRRRRHASRRCARRSLATPSSTSAGGWSATRRPAIPIAGTATAPTPRPPSRDGWSGVGTSASRPALSCTRRW